MHDRIELVISNLKISFTITEADIVERKDAEKEITHKAVPSYVHFMVQALNYLAEHNGEPVRPGAIFQALGEKLTPQQRRTKLPSGSQLTFRNRIGWAYHNLKHAGLAQNIGRGRWTATKEGMQMVAEGRANFEEMKRIISAKKRKD